VSGYYRRQPSGPPIWHLALFIGLVVAGVTLAGLVLPAAFQQWGWVSK